MTDHDQRFKTILKEYLEYLKKGNDLGVALSPLMKVPKNRRAWFKAEALQQLGRSQQTEQGKFLLTECVDTYLRLETPNEQKQFQRLIEKEQYREARTVTVTWFEEGVKEGQRKLLSLQLEEKFGPLSPQVRERLDHWPAEGLDELAHKLMHANSLSELGLEETS